MRSFGTQTVKESYECMLGRRIARAERYAEFPLNAVDYDKVNVFGAPKLRCLRRQQTLRERYGAKIVHIHHMLGHFQGRFLHACACRDLVLGNKNPVIFSGTGARGV